MIYRMTVMYKYFPKHLLTWLPIYSQEATDPILSICLIIQNCRSLPGRPAPLTGKEMRGLLVLIPIIQLVCGWVISMERDPRIFPVLRLQFHCCLIFSMQ